MNAIGTASYWEGRYASGGNSGAGSYGQLGLYKAAFLNRFVAKSRIQSIAELGCGDGAQLRRAVYPKYFGYDVSPSAVDRCAQMFKADPTKSFFVLSKVNSLLEVDLGLSLDVIYHLLEDEIYEEHLGQLFRMSGRYAIIYGNGVVKPYPAAHVRLHDFREAIRRRFPGWNLVYAEKNPFYSEIGTDPCKSWSNFYVYQAPQRSWHPAVTCRGDLSSMSADGPGPRLRMSGAEFLETPVQRWREIVRTAERGAVVTVPVGEFSRPPAESAAVALGYVREIVQDTRRGDTSETPEFWLGSLVTEPQIIVSLTTIKSRLASIEKVIASILGQSRIPDRVILNISPEPYLRDEGVTRDDLGPYLLKMEGAGLLEIRSVANTGPFRKLLPTLRSEWEANCVIVTADDDTLYPPFWLDELFSAYLKHRTVIAPRCHYLKTNGGAPRPYSEWISYDGKGDAVKPEHQGIFVFGTGKDGILYHPEFFTEAVFDPELIKIAPTCDDLVFKLATMLTATPVNSVPSALSSTGRFMNNGYPAVSQEGGNLWSINANGANDESFKKLLAYFGDRFGLSIRSFLQEGQVQPNEAGAVDAGS